MKYLNIKYTKGLKDFFLLWSTQSLSLMGSSLTSFALIIWSYEQGGSALKTALLSVSTYAPYVMLSIILGTLSDRWNKKLCILVCDTIAALSTLLILWLFVTNQLQLWHLYVLNFITGTMDAFQQPASDVAITLLTPKEQYQCVSGLRAFSQSLITILTPIIASALLAFGGLLMVLILDLITFVIAFLTLSLVIHIPNVSKAKKEESALLKEIKASWLYLKQNRGILDLILFLACINLVAAMHDAALPAMILSKTQDVQGLGWVNAFGGFANLAGSVFVIFTKKPKSRIRVICYALLFSMSTENFFMAFGNTLPIWCMGMLLGWISIPLMNANLDVILRERIPVEIQGRIFAVRNTLQFFTIPLGYTWGGWLIDSVVEPLMSTTQITQLHTLFGNGKGSGAAMLFFFIGIIGIGICLFFQHDRHIQKLETKNNE